MNMEIWDVICKERRVQQKWEISDQRMNQDKGYKSKGLRISRTGTLENLPLTLESCDHICMHPPLCLRARSSG